MSNPRSLLMSLVLIAGPLAAGAAWAADPAPPAAPAPDMQAMMHHGEHGKHGKRCAMHDKMMSRGHHMPQMIMIPRLPHGNDKLQLQMHAEILQKVGEIEAKYAAQLP